MTTYFIELTAVDWRNEPRAQEAPQPSLRIVGEDDLEQEVVTEVETPAPPPAETYPITINVDDIREYYPRRQGRNGTRITFKGGAARPVTESYADVQAKIAAARNNRLNRTR